MILWADEGLGCVVAPCDKVLGYRLEIEERAEHDVLRRIREGQDARWGAEDPSGSIQHCVRQGWPELDDCRSSFLSNAHPSSLVAMPRRAKASVALPFVRISNIRFAPSRRRRRVGSLVRRPMWD